MSAAAPATAAQRNCLPSERKWNIRIGRSTLHLGGVIKMFVHRTNYLQDVSIDSELASRTIPDLYLLA